MPSGSNEGGAPGKAWYVIMSLTAVGGLVLGWVRSGAKPAWPGRYDAFAPLPRE